MKTVNVRALHHRTGAIIDDVARGEIVLVEKRGQPVAEIRPSQRAAAGFPDAHWKRLRKHPKLKGDSGRFIREERDRS